MDLETLYLLQLLGAVAVGGFVGEFFRTSQSSTVTFRIFIANFLAGSFVSFLMGYVVYLATKQRQISILIAALISYQDEDFIARLARTMIRHWIGGGVEDKDD
jgi:hypothetical protein